MPASVDDDFWVAGSSTRARRKSQAYGEPLWGDAPKWEGPCELVVEPPIKSRYFESFLATFFASVEAATLLVDDVDLTLTPARDGKARRLRLDMRSNVAAADDGVAVTGAPLDPTRGLPLSRRHVKWKLRIADAAARSACAAELERGLENARHRARYEFAHPPLGKGAGGAVWRATDRFNGSEVAVKIPTYEVSGAIFFVMELCTGGDLFERVAARRRFGERDAARRDASSRASRRSTAAASCTSTSSRRTFCTPAEDDRVTRRLRGTVGYVAPEIVAATLAKRPPLYTCACDAFALGVVLFVLLVGYAPFFGDGDDDCLRKILHGSYTMRPEDWKRVSPGGVAVVTGLLATDPTARLSVEALARDAWLAGPPAAADAPLEPNAIPLRIDSLVKLRSRRSSERRRTVATTRRPLLSSSFAPSVVATTAAVAVVATIETPSKPPGPSEPYDALADLSLWAG
ncbi:serine/threonine kinase [Aureococcus anophagefferens]|nr:serine/threonine kinase [Aureococcus anophagefferens]